MKDKIIIQKIINYISDIEDFTNNMDAIDFLDDKKTIASCAFIVSQIGEISKEISVELQEKYSEIPWSSIRGMRNKIVHDYENVNLSVLWGTIKESLPDLKKKLKQILISETESAL